jgi:hypothetical protein
VREKPLGRLCTVTENSSGAPPPYSETVPARRLVAAIVRVTSPPSSACSSTASPPRGGRLARAVMQDMRRGVKQQHGLASVASLHAGVVTVVQRFRSDLGLYVHLHCLVTDGAYEEQNDGELRFLAAPPPTPERMTAVLAQVHEVIRAADDDLDLDPALAACLQLSLAGPRLAPDSPSAPPPMTLSAFGMNLHAATTADGRDRKQLERICGERNCWPTRDRGATAELLDARARGDGRVERLVGPPVRRPLLLG